MLKCEFVEEGSVKNIYNVVVIKLPGKMGIFRKVFF